MIILLRLGLNENDPCTWDNWNGDSSRSCHKLGGFQCSGFCGTR
jgi:hypothetical protein